MDRRVSKKDSGPCVCGRYMGAFECLCFPCDGCDAPVWHGVSIECKQCLSDLCPACALGTCPPYLGSSCSNNLTVSLEEYSKDMLFWEKKASDCDVVVVKEDGSIYAVISSEKL